MNSLPDLVLFDSGASRYFSRKFDISLGDLECPLRVSIANEHKVSTSSIFCDYTLEIFGVPYPIHLITIPMGDVYVIVGIDWLSRFGVMINYERKLVVVRDGFYTK